MGRLAKSEMSFKDREFGLDPESSRNQYIENLISREIEKFVSRELQKLQEQLNSDLSLLKAARFEPNSVFVVMPFVGEDINEVYRAIKEECIGIGLEATRVDEVVGSGFVIRDILTLIERAEFIICDLTYQRPNVYYELGYAHGVGNHGANILLIAKQGTELHFDIAPLRVKYYDSPGSLRRILQHSLKEMISITRKQNE